MNTQNLRVPDGGATSPVTSPAGPTSSGPASPLPWTAETDGMITTPSGVVIARTLLPYDAPVDKITRTRIEGEAKRDAAYLVTAANAYPSLLADVARLREALQAYVTQREKLRGFPQAWEPYSGADVLARAVLAATGKG